MWNHPKDGALAADSALTHRSLPTSTTIGQYTSLPLDGRLDLMMPRANTPEPQINEETEQSQLDQQQQDPSGRNAEPVAASHQEAEQQRQLTPPLHSEVPYHAVWDASRHPPPMDSRPEMAVSVNQVYAPAWDEPTATQTAYFNELRDDNALPSLPSNVLRNDWYGEFTGTVPDPDKAGKVFPWETAAGHRAQPSRVFPRQNQHEDGLSGQVAPTTTLASNTTDVTADAPKAQARDTAAKPIPSFGASMAEYTNAWDSDASIGRYAKRLTDLGIVTSRRAASGMQTVPPTPRRSTHRPPSERTGRTQSSSDRTPSGDAPQRSSGYMRTSYHDKCTQTERPPQSDAFVQASPDTSPVSESPPKLRTSSSPTAFAPATSRGRRAMGPPPASPKQEPTATAHMPMPRHTQTSKRVSTGGRVWDPRTDIDVMRRGGQQALARFSATGS